MVICYCVQLDRLVKEFIVPLEKLINSEQEEKQVVVEKESQENVGQKRRARTCTVKSSTSASSKEMFAVGGTKRSKRAKVAPTRYVSAEEESLDACFVIRNNELTASPRLLDHSSASDETTMNVNNEDTNRGSSPRVSDVAAATMVHKRRKECKTFDERFKDLMAFKAEFGHCNVPKTNSSNNKYSSLGQCRVPIPTYRTCHRDAQFDRIVSTVMTHSRCGVCIIITTPLAFNQWRFLS